MLPPLPALVLLAALVGGLGASSVHAVHHGQEWAGSRATHAAAGAHTAGTDLLTEPCVDGEAHGVLCAVCTGFAGTVSGSETVEAVELPPAREASVEVARVAHRQAVAPARGPPAPVA